MKRLLIIIAVVAAFAAGLTVSRLGAGRNGADHADGGAAETETRWTCAMHPQIILPTNDQQCPICFMDLIPLEENGTADLGPGDLSLGPAAAALAEIRVSPVRRAPAAREIRLVGKVSVDETRVSTITARFAGRLDRLFVDATGQQVRRGMNLAEIYSPELYGAQAELQAAARAAASGGSSAEATYRSARRKMDLWGLTPAQIDGIADGGPLNAHLTVTAPHQGVVVERQATLGRYVQTGSELYAIADLSRVWVTLDAFETDVAWLRENQTVTFTARALPGTEFTGEVLFVNPVMDERSRTVEVRVAVDNTGGDLKPGMLVTGRVTVALNAADDASADPLLIPTTAPLLTGERAVVYVRTAGTDGHAVFTGRQVTLGPRAGDDYVVLDGLSEGEEVVTHGVFKIDSALQILAKPSMMSSAVVTAATPDFQPALAALLAHYYQVQTALAGDDDDAARQAVAGLAVALEQANASAGTLTGPAAARWAQDTATLATAVQRMADSPDIVRRRQPLEDLSDTLWESLMALAYAGEAPVRRFHCPMAFDNRGANWIQADSTTANPYFGAAMLRCGWEVEVIQ